MDYSPYPGPDKDSQFDIAELDQEIVQSIEAAERTIELLTAYLRARR